MLEHGHGGFTEKRMLALLQSRAAAALQHAWRLHNIRARQLADLTRRFREAGGPHALEASTALQRSITPSRQLQKVFVHHGCQALKRLSATPSRSLGLFNALHRAHLENRILELRENLPMRPVQLRDGD